MRLILLSVQNKHSRHLFLNLTLNLMLLIILRAFHGLQLHLILGRYMPTAPLRSLGRGLLSVLKGVGTFEVKTPRVICLRKSGRMTQCPPFYLIARPDFTSADVFVFVHFCCCFAFLSV